MKCLTEPAQNCIAAIQSSAALFPVMQSHFVDVLHQIRAAAPNAKIVVLGYPRLFDPALSFGQTDQALRTSINGAVAALNGSISDAVTGSGTRATFVDVAPRFVGHEVNSFGSWIFFNPPTLSSGGTLIFDPRNFHPTQDGHQAYSDALLASVNLRQLARP